ncbi:hypothetical protein C0991_001155 [Blastosporella zonata]|nr:hypothetical protein C0991_001155 [Blastosporella zonata]
MPHTVHLAAVKLLKSVGALSSAKAKKATSRSSNYQNTVSVPLNAEDDGNDATAHNDHNEQEIQTLCPINVSNEIFTVVDKLRKIVCAVCSSPQCKQHWLQQVSENLRKKDPSSKQHALMLILDVKTQWSSTHQMMGRVLDHRDMIDNFVGLHRDLQSLELSNVKWDAIEQVAKWLEAFRSATTEMS